VSATRTAGPLAGPGRFSVPSASTPDRTHAVIWVGPAAVDCPCPGFTFRGTCRHVAAVEALLREERRDGAADRLRAIARELDCD
jgi:uncharacterized Zn finger protein